jgi:hypothetical protein
MIHDLPRRRHTAVKTARQWLRFEETTQRALLRKVIQYGR